MNRNNALYVYWAGTIGQIIITCIVVFLLRSMEIEFNYSTIITFLSWGIWHFLYFYIDGSLYQIQAGYFLLGLFTNCFILSALYNKTNSLWICVMAHALINTLSQISIGGNECVSFICRGIIIMILILICIKEKRKV